MEILSLFGLALIFALSPNFNTAVIFSCAMRFGLRASIPVGLGICLGAALMTLALVMSMSALSAHWQIIEQFLRLLSAFYLLVLIWMLINLPAKSELNRHVVRKWWNRFFAAFMFQAINPSTWLASVAMHKAFASDSSVILSEHGLIALIYFLVLLVSVLAWGFAGVGIQKLVISESYQKLFNYLIAGAMLIAVAVNY